MTWLDFLDFLDFLDGLDWLDWLDGMDWMDGLDVLDGMDWRFPSMPCQRQSSVSSFNRWSEKLCNVLWE